MSILKRTLLGFGLIIAIVLVQGGIGLWAVDRLGNQADMATSRPIAQMDAARSAWEAFHKAEQHLADIGDGIRFHASDDSLAHFAVLIGDAEAQLAQLGVASGTAGAAAKARSVQTDVAEWKRNAHILLGQSPATSIPAPHVMDASSARIRAGLDDLQKIALDDARGARIAMRSETTDAKEWTLALGALGLIVGVAVAFIAARSITRPMEQLERRMHSLSKGDLHAKIEGVNRADEIGSMARALEIFRANAMAIERMNTDKIGSDAAVAAERQRLLDELAAGFESRVAAVVTEVETMLGGLGASAGRMANAAMATREEVLRANSAAESAAISVACVAGDGSNDRDRTERFRADPSFARTGAPRHRDGQAG